MHYITAIVNVPSVLEHGLLSHRRAALLPHKSVAMAEIQDRRAPKQVPGGRPLHDYVNLYVNARNPMLSKVLYDRSIDDVCVLRVHLDVIDEPGVVIADQNAASDYVRFADARVGLDLIHRETVFAESWKHPSDQIAEWRHKSAMCAEVLVPDTVVVGRISGAYVGCSAASQKFAAVAGNLPVTLNEYLFFR